MLGSNPFPQPFGSPFANPQPGSVRKPVQQNNAPREQSMPRFVNYLADYSGCGHWRILWPEQVINMTQRGISQSTTAMVADPRWYAGVKCVKLQRQASKSQVEFVKHLKKVQQEHGFKIIYEVDDVVFREEIPDYNKFKFAFDTAEVRANCVEIMNLADEITLTCDFMRNLFKSKLDNDKVTVIPNFVPHTWMGYLYDRKRVQQDFEKYKKKPRILYTGSGAHYDVNNKNGGKDDMSEVNDIIRKTVNKYQWIFVGAYPPPLTDLVKSGKIEFYPWKSLLEYPGFIANLGAQLMVAPLTVNNFNNSKSDIKFIEACTLGIPCLCQDMDTYQNAPDDLKFKTPEEFEEKIDWIVNYKNRKRYFTNIDQLREVGKGRTLELDQNIGAHIEALMTPYGSPQRKWLKKWNP
jgi:glycosyltransferase involved in cell wall biosynthesis